MVGFPIALGRLKMTTSEQKVLWRGVAAGILIGVAVGLMIALVIAIRPELTAGIEVGLAGGMIALFIAIRPELFRALIP